MVRGAGLGWERGLGCETPGLGGCLQEARGGLLTSARACWAGPGPADVHLRQGVGNLGVLSRQMVSEVPEGMLEDRNGSSSGRPHQDPVKSFIL